MTSTKKNYIYNLILNISNILISIVIIPFLSRKLGSEQIGIYSYTNSVVSFFMLFSLLGIKNYGNRLIAGLSDKKEKSKEFLSLYTLQIVVSILVSIVYILYTVMLCEKIYQPVAFVQTLHLLSVTFEVNWFYYGNEEFKLPLIVGTVSKFIYFLLILTFVHNPSDLIVYTIIVSFYSLINNICLVCLLRKQIFIVKFTSKDVLKHLKPCLVLFLPVISVSIYKIMDKIMLGKMTSMIEVGLYEQAEKITRIPLQLISTLEAVMLPRMTNIISSKNENTIQIDKSISNSLGFIMFAIMPIVTGLICIADDFVPLFLGYEFYGSSTLLKGLSMSLVFIAYGCVIRTHYIIPKKKDKIYVYSVTLGATFNIILNFILIPTLGAKGAVIATILAEFIVVFYQSLCLKKFLDLKRYIKVILNYLVKTLIMSIFVVLVGLINFKSIYLKLLVQIIVGIVIYSILNINNMIDFLPKKKLVLIAKIKSNIMNGGKI